MEVNFRRRAIFSAMQTPPGDVSGPIPNLFNVAGPVGAALQGELEWRLHDFCRIHQIVYKEIKQIDEKLDAIDPALYTLSNHDIEDESNLGSARIRTAIIEHDLENARVISFVDQMAVVGLWAIAEQFLGKVYRQTKSLLESIPPDSVNSDYRWDGITAEYSTLGIDLTQCENFANADECRVLNNTIKHASIVNPRLQQFPFFQAHAGKNLDKVPLEMQRYMNGVSDFLGNLISKANDLVELTP